MRRHLPLAVCAAVVLLAGQASAQFANRRLGVELGGYRFTDADVTVGLPLVIDGTYYIENGFDVGLRVPLTLYLTRASNQQYFGLGANVYVRYLFSEESLRPWLGLEVDFAYIFRGDDSSGNNQRYFFGPGASLGLDYFVTDTISIGPRGFFTLYLALNNGSSVVRPTYGGTLDISAYF